jgi:hypothetical protein
MNQTNTISPESLILPAQTPDPANLDAFVLQVDYVIEVLSPR